MVAYARSRCPFHGLLLDDDATCGRCARDMDADAVRRSVTALRRLALVLFAVMLVGSVLVLGGRASKERQDERAAAAAAVLAGTKGRVVVYTATWCPACQSARSWLDSQHVTYESRDVDVPRFNRELGLLGGRGIPQVVIDGEILETGFNASKLDWSLFAHRVRARP